MLGKENKIVIGSWGGRIWRTKWRMGRKGMKKRIQGRRSKVKGHLRDSIEPKAVEAFCIYLYKCLTYMKVI